MSGSHTEMGAIVATVRETVAPTLVEDRCFGRNNIFSSQLQWVSEADSWKPAVGTLAGIVESLFEV